jgi:bacterioferritin-associated ferredoxin
MVETTAVFKRSKLERSGVIVCSCNVLSDKQILATLQLGAGPQAASQVYRCLGCAPRCGRCLETVRALLAQAHLDNCKVGCAACPATDAHHGEDKVAEDAPAFAAAG